MEVECLGLDKRQMSTRSLGRPRIRMGIGAEMMRIGSQERHPVLSGGGVQLAVVDHFNCQDMRAITKGVQLSRIHAEYACWLVGMSRHEEPTSLRNCPGRSAYRHVGSVITTSPDPVELTQRQRLVDNRSWALGVKDRQHVNAARDRQFHAWEDHQGRERWILSLEVGERLSCRFDTFVAIVICDDDAIDSCVNVRSEPLFVTGLGRIVLLPIQTAKVE